MKRKIKSKKAQAMYNDAIKIFSIEKLINDKTIKNQHQLFIIN